MVKNDGEKTMAKRDPSDRLHLPQAPPGELRLPGGKRHSLNPSTHFTASLFLVIISSAQLTRDRLTGGVPENDYEEVELLIRLSRAY